MEPDLAGEKHDLRLERGKCDPDERTEEAKRRHHQERVRKQASMIPAHHAPALFCTSSMRSTISVPSATKAAIDIAAP